MTKQQWKAEHRRRRVVRRWGRYGQYEIACLIGALEYRILAEYEDLHGWGNPMPPRELERKMKEAAQKPENWFLR